MNSQPHTLGIRNSNALYCFYTEKKKLETGLSEFKLKVINKRRITSSKYVPSNKDWKGTEDKLKIEKKLKGKSA